MQEVVLLFLFMHVLSPCLRKTESDSSRVVIGGEECTFFVAGVEEQPTLSRALRSA